MAFTWTNIASENAKINPSFLTEAKEKVILLETYSGTTAFSWGSIPASESKVDDLNLAQFKTAIDNYETNRNAKACTPFCNTVCTTVQSSYNATYLPSSYLCTTHYASYCGSYLTSYCPSHLTSYCTTHYGTYYATKYVTYNSSNNCGCGEGK